jgi:hypothetical protein
MNAPSAIRVVIPLTYRKRNGPLSSENPGCRRNARKPHIRYARSVGRGDGGANWKRGRSPRYPR